MLFGWLKGSTDKKFTRSEISDTHTPVNGSLDANIRWLRDFFADTADLSVRRFTDAGGRKMAVVFFEGMVDTDLLHRDVVQRLMDGADGSAPDLAARLVTASEVALVTELEDMAKWLLYGKCMVIVDKSAEALSVNLIGGAFRGVEEPANEHTIRGPREGFVENLVLNLGMVRRRLRDPNLVVECMELGRRTKTRVALVYLKDLVSLQLLEEARRRLSSIDIDSTAATSYIEQLIEDNPHTLFPQVLGTERPDRVVAMLLEGHVAILAEGTPYAITAPVVFAQLFQATEDYYERWVVGTVGRILRFMAFFIASSLTAGYIALTSFHTEMLPFGMLTQIAQVRRELPFPPILEALIMEFTIEFLREAGLRLPGPVSQTVGVVGGIVLGSAAITAKLVAPLLVIITAVSALASFTIPTYSVALNMRLIRFPMMLLAATLGAVGIVFGWLFMLLHLSRLKSFGVFYMTSISPARIGDWKDIFVRGPLTGFENRPAAIPVRDRRRANFQRRRPNNENQ